MNITICDVPHDIACNLANGTDITIMRDYGGKADIFFNGLAVFHGISPVYTCNKERWHFYTKGRYNFNLNPNEIGNIYISEVSDNV